MLIRQKWIRTDKQLLINTNGLKSSATEMDICILSPPATPSLEDTNSSCSTDSEHQPSKNSLTVSCTRSRRETAINCIGLDYLCVLVRGAIFCSFVRHSVILEWTFEYSPIHYIIGSHEFRRDSRVILQWGTNRQPTGEKIPMAADGITRSSR